MFWWSVGYLSSQYRKWQLSSKSTMAFRNALKSLKYENGSKFLKNQYFSLNAEIDFMLMSEVWSIENFLKNFEDSLFSFSKNEKLPIASMKQVIMILILEILKFDNIQSCLELGRKLYSYNATSAQCAYLNCIFLHLWRYGIEGY